MTKDEFYQDVQEHSRLIAKDCICVVLWIALIFATGRRILDAIESYGYSPNLDVAEIAILGCVIAVLLTVFTRTEKRAESALPCPSCKKSLRGYQKTIKHSGICPFCQGEVWDKI